MAVRIPVSADASQAVAAFNAITQAIRKTGQEGRKLNELDFSHPELKGVESELHSLQANFEELQKVGRGATAAAVRQGKYTDVLDWHARHARQFPDENARYRHSATVGRYVTQGTRWQPRAQVPDEEFSRPRGKRGGGLGPLPGGIPIPGIGGLIKSALAFAGIGGIASMAKQGVGYAQQEAIGVDVLKRSLNDTGESFAGLRERIEQASQGLQLTYNETVKLAQGFARASNLQSGQKIAAGVQLSAGFGRSFGLDPGLTGNLFGRMRYLGVSGKNGMDEKQLALMFADAIGSGKMWAKSDEVMQSIAHWVQSSERVMVTAPNVRGYTEMAAEMNAAGEHGMPGLRGEAGAALLQQISNAVQHGGAFGAAGKAFLWRAMNQPGMGPQLGPFRTRFLEEAGPFASRESVFGNSGNPGDQRFATSGKTIMAASMEQVKREYRRPHQREAALANLYGISMHQAGALFALQARHHDGLRGVQRLMQEAGVSYKELNPSGFKELSQIAYAKHGGLEKIRKQFLARDDLSTPERHKIKGATSDKALRDALAEAAAKHGRTPTIGSQVQQASADLQKALNKVGQELLTPITAIKGMLAKQINGGAALLEDTKDAFFGVGKQRTEARHRLEGGAKEVGLTLLKGAMTHGPTGRLNALVLQAGERLGHWFSQHPRPMPAPRLLPVKGMPTHGLLDVHNQLEIVHKSEKGETLHTEFKKTTSRVPMAHHG